MVKQKIILRTEAKATGLSRYFTGMSCKHGHVAERATSSGRCVECNKVLCSKWQGENRSWVNSYRKAWWVETSTARQKYQQEWYYRDVERRRQVVRERRKTPAVLKLHNEKNAAWRKQNPKYHLEWYEKNIDKARRMGAVAQNKRRARKREAEGVHSQEDLKAIYKLQNGKCAYCKVSLRGGYQVDHIVPLLKGGSNWPHNIQLLCVLRTNACNQKKSTKDPVDFARTLGLLL